MQKFIITVAVPELIKAEAVFESAPQRGPNAVDVVIPSLQGSVGIEGQRDVAQNAFVFTTRHDFVADEVIHDLNVLKVPHDVEVYAGEGLRVNVLELLSTGWSVCAPKDRQILRVQLPNDSTIDLMFRNDGENLYAEYDGIDTPTSKMRRATLQMLVRLLQDAAVTFEVL